MEQTRREFMSSSVGAGLAIGAGLCVPGSVRRALGQPVGGKKKILFLGGTGFIGPHIVRALLAEGHTVTLFNRGNRDELFPDLELITGSPSARRRYIDITLCQTDSVYCRTLSGYNKLLEQRNASLKKLAETGRGKDVVNILSERLKCGIHLTIALQKCSSYVSFALTLKRH